MQVFLKVKRRVATGSKTSFYTKSQKSSISIPRRATQLYCRLSLGQSQAHRKSRRFVAGLWAIQLFLNRVLTCWTFAWMHRPILSFIQVFAWILPRDAMQARPIPLCGVHLSVGPISVTFVLCRNESPFWFCHTKPYGTVPTGNP